MAFLYRMTTCNVEQLNTLWEKKISYEPLSFFILSMMCGVMMYLAIDNYGKNQNLMERCQILKEYAVFINKCKRYVKMHPSTSEAINRAVDECISEDVLKEFLITHRGEVLEVLLTEFDEEKYAKAMKNEGYEAGYSEGRARERKENIKLAIELILEGDKDLEVAIVRVSKKYELEKDEVWEIWNER